MVKKLNWETANKKAKRHLSITDENEYRDNDGAARWIARAETRNDEKPGKADARTVRKNWRKQKKSPPQT